MGTKSRDELEIKLDRLLREMGWSLRKFVRELYENEFGDYEEPVPGEKQKDFNRFYDKYKKQRKRKSRSEEALEKDIRDLLEMAKNLNVSLDHVAREPVSLGLLPEDVERELRNIFSEIGDDTSD